MKPYYIIALTLLLVPYISVGQSLEISAKAGINYSNVKGDFGRSLSSASVFGYSIGVQLEKRLNERFSFQPELLVSGRGYSYSNAIYSGRQRHSFYLIDIPLLAKYSIVKNLSIEAGPQFSHLTGSNLLFQNINTYHLSLIGGISEKISDQLSLGIRYSFGITNIFKKSEGLDLPGIFHPGDFIPGSSPERYFQIYVAYSFFKKEAVQ